MPKTPIELFAEALQAQEVGDDDEADREGIAALMSAGIGGDFLHVDAAHLCLRRNFFGSSARDDAEFRLRQSECRFVVEPFLDPGLVIENGTQFFGAPHVLEQRRIEDAGRHGSPHLIGSEFWPASGTTTKPVSARRDK